jgi:hypothetical protein
MKTLEYNYIFVGLSFLLVALSGIRLTKTGSPYKQGILVIHKFATLAFIAFSVVVIVQWIKLLSAGVSEITLLILSGLAIITLLASGGKLSHDNDGSKPLARLHKLGTVAVLVFASLIVFTFLKDK